MDQFAQQMSGDYDKYPLSFQIPSFLFDPSHMTYSPYDDAPSKYYPVQHLQPTHRPFEFDSPTSHDDPPSSSSTSPPTHPSLDPAPPFSNDLVYPPHAPMIPPSLPLYSASGFDMLTILSKVASRPNPRIMLGPVDMTCSFVVSDMRHGGDAPMVYASPTFCRLTGYSEAEILGRNCRFLQSPSGSLQRGDPRLHTAPDAVRHIHRALLQDKECQASLINYRKDGSAFVNLITLIPICLDDDDEGSVTHYVGFQVDLAEQPGAILQRLRDGSYIVNYSMIGTGGMSMGGGLGGMGSRRGRGVSAELVEMLKRAQTAGPAPAASSSAGAGPSRESERADVHALVLENSDDFVHVLSLKGSLLFVSPAITRVLGYAASELVGRSISDLCHPADIVPVMRELKEASSASAPVPPHPQPRKASTTTTTTAPFAFGMPSMAMNMNTTPYNQFQPIYPASSSSSSSSNPYAQPSYPAPAPAPSHPHPRHNPFYGPPSISTPFAPSSAASASQNGHAPPTFASPSRPVTSLLFRARHKNGHYVWLLCRGRLHVEPGKGRKAVVMVGRKVRDVIVEGCEGGGGVMGGELLGGDNDEDADAEEERPSEWGIVAPNGLVLSGSTTLLHPPPPSASSTGTGTGARRGLVPPLPPPATPSSPADPAPSQTQTQTPIGKTLTSLVAAADARKVGDAIANAACVGERRVRRVRCRWVGLGGGGGEGRAVEIRFYAMGKVHDEAEAEEGSGGKSILPAGIVFEVVWVRHGAAASRPDGFTPVESALSSSPASPTQTPNAHPLSLSASSETSWQYELTKLRFENERLRAEAMRLERRERRRVANAQVTSASTMAADAMAAAVLGSKRAREEISC